MNNDGVLTLTAWLFYAGNVLLIAAYLVIAALLLRPRGFTGRGQLSPTLTTITVLFFVSCALLHTELAVHAYQRVPLVVRDDGGVDLPFTVLVLVQLFLVIMFSLLTSRRAHHNDPVVPFSPTAAEVIEATVAIAARCPAEQCELREMVARPATDRGTRSTP